MRFTVAISITLVLVVQEVQSSSNNATYRFPYTSLFALMKNGINSGSTAEDTLAEIGKNYGENENKNIAANVDGFDRLNPNNEELQNLLLLLLLNGSQYNVIEDFMKNSFNYPTNTLNTEVNDIDQTHPTSAEYDEGMDRPWFTRLLDSINVNVISDSTENPPSTTNPSIEDARENSSFSKNSPGITDFNTGYTHPNSSSSEGPIVMNYITADVNTERSM